MAFTVPFPTPTYVRKRSNKGNVKLYKQKGIIVNLFEYEASIVLSSFRGLLQAAGYLGRRSSSVAQHGRKEIVGPFQVEYAEKEMYGHEHHRPMPESTGFLDFRHRHLHEYIHDERIKQHANDDPSQVKEKGDDVHDNGMYGIFAFVEDASKN